MPSRNSITRRGLLRGAAALALGSRVAQALGSHVLAAPSGDSTLVATPSGSLQGALENGVRVFRGVPFAAPPVGPLRFRPPVPLKPWSGVRQATRFASAAMQEPHGGVALSEDCLYLNIWAPAGKGPYPVFFWIHGGGYVGGESFAPIFDGAGFAQAGVVVVTVAYRLGAFGFMDLEPLLGASYADSGNNGTRDLVASLRWVHENIAAFGGDPTQVTIGGESAGAKGTAALMAIPEAAGWYRSAISESGGGERVLTRETAAEVAHEFAAQWKVDGETADLRQAPAAALIETQRRLISSSPLHFPFRAEIGGALLPKRPVDLITAGSSRGKRLLIGTNRDESALFLPPHPQPPVKPSDLGNLPVVAFNEVFAKYASLYPDMSLSQQEIRAVTAEEYWVPSVRVADGHVKNGGDAWMYRLDFARDTGRNAGEAYHSEDLGFVWDKLSPDERQVTEAQGLAAEMHAAWLAFIAGRTPAAEGLPAWPQYTSDRRPTMILDRQSRVEERPCEAELRLWDGVL